MNLKGFRFEPVRYATGALALITALIAVNEIAHVIPEAATPYLLGAETLLAILLGKVVRDRVTPLAAPRDAGERALVPVAWPSPDRPA